MSNPGPASSTTSMVKGAGVVNPDGFMLGSSASALVGFYGATPVVQQAGGQAAVTTTSATTTSPFGFATSAQANNIVLLVNEMRAALVAYGLLGS